MSSICQSITGRLRSAAETFLPRGNKEKAAVALSCAATLASTGAGIAAWGCYAGYKWLTADRTNPDEVHSVYTPLGQTASTFPLTAKELNK